eukprot:TRINITY_DN13354_c0_g1_i1.p1 TRINITY_DN13354_c0_g1~~TRINITY_DN13354_c0_g1_i1.p1  ORF type:complete len:224 (-),score=35.10 TRINITY_DN13354_c0_g1_i1:194-772(-)
MGDAGTGKSCLIKRFCEERFVEKYVDTIGVDYGVKTVKLNKENLRGYTPQVGEEASLFDLKVDFWDLAGNPAFLEVRNEFYRDTHGVLLVFDVGSRRSFESLEGWLSEATQCGLASPFMILCGNKIDSVAGALVSGPRSTKRAVSEKEALTWASTKGLKYFETSANTGDNVVDIFHTLFYGALLKLQPDGTK